MNREDASPLERTETQPWKSGPSRAAFRSLVVKRASAPVVVSTPEAERSEVRGLGSEVRGLRSEVEGPRSRLRKPEAGSRTVTKVHPRPNYRPLPNRIWSPHP